MRRHLTADEARRIAYLRDMKGLGWKTIARQLGRTDSGVKLAYARWMSGTGRLARKTREASR